MIKTHEREKLINAIVFFAANTEHCGKIKLLKLLYLLDFEHFRQTGYSVTGMEYHAWKMGPVPTDLYNANSILSTSPGASCASCGSWPHAFMATTRGP